MVNDNTLRTKRKRVRNDITGVLPHDTRDITGYLLREAKKRGDKNLVEKYRELEQSK